MLIVQIYPWNISDEAGQSQQFRVALAQVTSSNLVWQANCKRKDPHSSSYTSQCRLPEHRRLSKHGRNRRIRLSYESTKPNPLSVHCVILLSLFLCVAHGKKTSGPLLGFFSKHHGQDCEKAPSMCRAHSHNDYHQANPLKSALQHGLKSVEVDVFPRRDGLWVGHTVWELDPNRTIDNLYIQPLLEIFQRKERAALLQRGRMEEGSIPVCHGTRANIQRRRAPLAASALNSYPRGGFDFSTFRQGSNLPAGKVDNLGLLVDFKEEADKSASLLQAALSPIRPFLSKVDRNGVFHQGRLTVLISGNRPSVASLRAANGERFLFLDGRVQDVRANTDTHLVPLVSVPWRQVRLAKAMGKGERYMKGLSRKAHAQGKLVRIWGAPNREESWREMVRGNIDLLSIDDHAKFASFVMSRP